FALDGYSIYGYTGWNDEGEVVEMTSSYQLKDGADGSGGINDYEYIQGLGTLDACNGIFSETPDWPEGVYHYHTTMFNGDGGIGFPYFINCYAGELPSGDDSGDDDEDPCAGHGETWGPGIGPPPDGCGGGPPGGQSSEGGLIAIPWSSNPPNIGLIIISVLMMAVIYRYSRESAFGSSALNQADKVREYHLTPKLA
ncbi:MAG: YHYH protein, partial [Euryarchaeota archaeon]|nr:YHYH protein [Euryarchaeota archaeon]MBT6073232.1 YHYH protein [Euryarchaeota archaeon]